MTRMPGVVVLHVGLMKSGTTFVQQQLFAQKDTLGEAGVLVPCRSWGRQVGAAKDVLRGSDDGVWAELVEEVAAHDGRSVVSVELLGPGGRPQRRRVVESLRPHRVEVVITARDLNRQAVSLWQETIQNGRVWSWADYLDGVQVAIPPGPEDVPDTGRTFWRQQDLHRIATSWAEVADRVSVVTVPPPGAPRDLLLGRFTEAAGLPAMEVVDTGANESLGLASVLALREVNQILLDRGLTFPPGRQLRKKILAKDVLAARRSAEPSLGLDVPPWLAQASADLVERVRAEGFDLYGDWADLTPVPVPGVRIEDVPESAVREAAVAGLAGLLEHLIREE